MRSERKFQGEINWLVKEAGIGGEFPVPVEKIADYLGFSYSFFEPDDRTMHISGAVDHAWKKIYINKHESLQIQLFRVAHELGHLVLHGTKEDYVDYKADSCDPKEIEANTFAENLLMPEPIFQYVWKSKGADISAMSRFFGVSRSAVVARAKALCVVSHNQRYFPA